MAENSNIEWTTHTFNPWVGCTKVGPGCDNCYAESLMDRRLKVVRWGSTGTRRRTTPANWRKPFVWHSKAKVAGERHRVFCASLADVFENRINPQWRLDLWELIRKTPNLDWLLLTKRVGNIRRMLPEDWGDGYPNVWLGITVVTQEEADRDIPKLSEIPARIRFLSCEPLIESVDFRISPYTNNGHIELLDGIDWVIVGGESGPNARPLSQSWCEDIARQCRQSGTAFFMKQGSQANWPHWKEFERWGDSIRKREFPIQKPL